MSARRASRASFSTLKGVSGSRVNLTVLPVFEVLIAGSLSGRNDTDRVATHCVGHGQALVTNKTDGNEAIFTLVVTTVVALNAV